MPLVPVRLEPPATDDLAAGFAAIRAELGIDDSFPPDALSEAEASARRGPSIAPGADLRDIPFVTIDPEGSRDLDQALHVSRSRPTGAGWLVRYAIADVAAFVAPGGALDAEARRRGVTVYLPDGRVPLHPAVLSEGAASLLPCAVRQAVVWRIELDGAAAVRDVGVERATVRSRRQYTYNEVQAALDAGTTDDAVLLELRDLGRLLVEREAARGGISLDLPSGKFSIDPQTHHVVMDINVGQIQDRKINILESYPQQHSLDTSAVCDLKKNPDDNTMYVIKV